MALYNFYCESCKESSRRLLDKKELSDVRCQKCQGELKRTPKPPSAMVTERLDSGFMVKAVERPAEAERLYRERADKAQRGEE